MIYFHIMVNVWLCSKFSCIWVRIYSYGRKISEFNLDYVELCDGCSNFGTMYSLNFFKSIGFFMTDLWTQNVLPFQFLQCWTKFRYYYNYYVLILQCKVELYIENNWIIQLSMINGLLWNLWIQIYIFMQFLILFHVYVVQFGITFDMLL
jgi:hypothetical protein